ncbi:hypothetical protein Tco_0512431 [Tanacetum coccineum]
MSMWIISRGVVLLILLMLGISFKFDISGLLHHVITTIAYRIRDKDTSQSKQNLQSSSMTFIHKTLIIPSVLDSCFISSTVSEVKRVVDCSRYTPSFRLLKIGMSVWGNGKTITETSPKRRSYEENTFQDMLNGLGVVNTTHDINGFKTQVKTMKIPGWNTSFKTRYELRSQTSAVEALWKTILLL